MADGQVFRIEIPVEVTSKADTGQLRQVETTIQRTAAQLEKIASSGDKAFGKIASSASSAASSMQQVDSAAEKSADAIEEISDSTEEIEGAADGAAESVGEIGDAAKEAGNAAKDAGSSAKDAFNDAGQSADKFSQRMEKSNKSLRQMFGEKLKMTFEAIDKISPIVKDITSKVKSFAGKVWKVTLKAVDLVTAPFRALKNMIMSPITMTLSIAGIGLGASSFYQTFTDFTTGMSNVKALSGATDEEFRQLTATAADLGATTKFTAAQASEGMQYLAMAGWETSEIIAGMPGLLQLAAAGATDLGTAADIVSDVMTAMGMDASEATRAADIFAKTATSTNTTISNMGETLKYAAPIAHSFGLSLEEVSTITGMMANAGIKGSQAGTAIRSSLLAMASPSTEAAKAMSKLGLSFADSEGKMKDMKTIVRDLQTAFSGLSEQEKLAYADDIFGKYASSGWLGVINQGAEAYDKLYDSILNSKGAAQEMADIQLDNLQGDVTLLQSAVDGMKVSLMDKINPFLREGVQWITSKIPEITEMLGNLIDIGISKARQLKDYISDVFSSDEMQNADSLADKLFIAWDKIIAQPFGEWWNASGRDFVLSIVNKVGTTFGEVIHGVITGIFAALKGEEIDFEGLNLTGIAKAGAEAAKEYVTSFVQGLNAGGILGEMPGGLKAGLIGFGALKVGTGIYKGYKEVTALGAALKILKGGAAAAAPAMTTMATATSSATASAAGGASAFGGLGTALAAIPGWGWAALAVLAAVGIGLKLHADAQERERQELLHLSDDVDEAADRYVASAKKAQEVRGTFDQIHEIEITIEEGGKNEETVQNVRETIDSITDRTVWLEARLANTTLTPDEIEAYEQELETVRDRKAYLEAALAEGTLTSRQVEAYQAELDVLTGREVELEAALAEGTLTVSDIEKYQAELDELHGNKVELEAVLTKNGYNIAEVAMIEAQVDRFQEGQKRATLMIANHSDLTPAQIQDYVTRLGQIATKKAKLEVMLAGASLTPDEITEYKTRLGEIKTAKANIEIKMAEGKDSMTPDEWNQLVSEYTALTDEEAKISLMIDGSELDTTQVEDLKTQIDELQTEASNIMLQISENSDMDENDINELAQLFQDFGDMNVLLNFGLSAGSLTKEDLEQYNQQLENLYGNLSDLTGGAFSQEDIASGAVTQEQVEDYVLADAAANREELAETIQTAEYKLPDAIAMRDQYRGSYEEKETDIANATTALSDLKIMQREVDALEAQNRMQLEQLRNGDLSWEGYEAWQNDTYLPALEGFNEKWERDIVPNLTTSEGYNMTGLEGPQTTFDFEEAGGYATAIYDLESYLADETPVLEQRRGDYEQQNDALVGLYEGKKTLLAADNFGSDVRYAGNSIEEMAAQYATLDEAGRQMFENALMGLSELNASTDYITDEEKTNTESITQMAMQSVEAQANTDIIGDVQKRLMDMSNTYERLTDAGREAWDTGNLERLNSELADLNLDPLESLDTSNIEALQGALDALGLDVDLSQYTDMGEALNAAQEAISGMDTEAIQGLNFDAAASSLELLGGNADDARGKVAEAQAAIDELNARTADSAATSVSGVGSKASAAKRNVDEVSSAVDALDGKTADVTINVHQNGSTNVSVPHATGGIFNSAHVGLVAEDGPEAIIPLGAKRRDRGLDLWMEAGRMLGISAYAEGGILGPYAGTFASLPEDSWDDDGGGSGDYKPSLNGGGEGNVIQVTVDVNPEYKIDGTGGDADAILEAIRSHQNELAELLGAAMADQLEDIITNM